MPVARVPKGMISLAAGTSEAQQKFLKAMGLISTINIDISAVMSETEASIFSCALNHFQVNPEELADPYFVNEVELSDPYFTKEEWNKVVLQRKLSFATHFGLMTSTLTSAKTLLTDVIKKKPNFPVESAEECVKDAERCVENPPIVENHMCECITHRVEEDLNRFTYPLIEITPPLDDDSGYRLASSLLYEDIWIRHYGGSSEAKISYSS